MSTRDTIEVTRDTRTNLGLMISANLLFENEIVIITDENDVFGKVRGGVIVTDFDDAATNSNQGWTGQKISTELAGKEDSRVNKYDATAAPTANDDASNTSGNGVFSVGSVWIDVTNDEVYRCADSTATAAVWVNTSLEAGELAAIAVSGDGADLANPVPLTKIANISGDNILGRVSPGTGQIEQLTQAQVRTLLDVYTTTQVDNLVDAAATIESFAGNKTLATGDEFKYLRATDSVAQTVTIPNDTTDNMTIGKPITIAVIGSGGVTITGEAGVTVNGDLTINQDAAVTVMKVAANEWDVR